jgi:cation:H+ antiporter
MHDTDLWMAGLGVVVTLAYLVGILMRPKRTFGRIGPDSAAVLGLYAAGIVGLVIIGG